MVLYWILLFALTGAGVLVTAVEVHFETPDSGFFLKHSPRQTMSSVSDVSLVQGRTLKDQDTVLSVDKFTIIQTTQPVSIRATYGPFSTKQTVPARYIVPDVMESQSDHAQNATAALMDLQQSNLHLDISAHLVRPNIPRDSPVLRVLFHAGADPSAHLQRQRICVLLHVSMTTHTPLKGRCMPEGDDGVCVAEVIIPSTWWPPLPPPEKDGRIGNPPKVPQRLVQVSYSVFEPPPRNPELCEPKVQIQPLTSFAQVPLVQALSTYKELRADDTLTMLVPHKPLFPLSRFHVPVFLHTEPQQNVAVFIVRARVKAGMRILGATASSDQWNISVEKENAKHTVARVTAFRKDQDPDSTTKESSSETTSSKIIEVFSWLLEVVNETESHWDGGRIVWSVSYVHDGPKMKDSSTESTGAPQPDDSRRRLVAKLDIQKDDVQAVLPISKNWELMNTAVLTGRQVSQAMKVFIVSQAGKVADVTLQSSCNTEDERVIKVSSSCSSVYVDGSELRGSLNASITVKYGPYLGLAKYIVWMPEFPLEVSVADFRLSQIKGWKIPEDHAAMNKMKRRKRAYGWNHHADDFVNGVVDRSSCRARYQQSSVEIYAKFLAVDQDAGRTSYLISRRTGLRVTDLVQPLLRVADPKIATLRGRTLQGRAMGRTDVQVLSPINGRVIGSKEVRVGSDKVSITRLIVRVVSGLQLNITSENSIENGYIAETTVTRRLTAQYQEGLLDIDLEFSDGARTPLRDVSVDDYFLLVESLDTEVVAFAPMLASHHPRVIAVGEGNGDLLRVTLLLSEECRLRRNVPLSKQGPKTNPGPLASALASVQVDFTSTENPNRPDTVQNDGFSNRERKGGRDLSDLTDILIGIPLKDDSSHEPTIQATHQRGGLSPLHGNHKNLIHHDMSSLEIGMYVVLTAICFAIVVFVISCVVYASKFRPVLTENRINDNNGNNKEGTTVANVGIVRERRVRESTQNAHDWVWLGRSTMDRSMGPEEVNGNMMDNHRDSRAIRITSNPMNLNYSDPDDAILQATSFDNPNHIQLPSGDANGYPIDTSTYNKRDRRSKHKDDDIPPPLPPHGMPLNEQTSNSDYRPPVPPHRNIGVTANVNGNCANNSNTAVVAATANNNNNNNGNSSSVVNGNNSNGISNRSIYPKAVSQQQQQQQQFPQKRHHHHNKHHRTSSNVGQQQQQQQINRRSTGGGGGGSAVGTSISNPNPIPEQQITSMQSHPLSQANQVSTNLHNLNLTQQYINAALFNVNSAPNTGGAGGYFPRLVNPVPPLRSPPKSQSSAATPAPTITAVQQKRNSLASVPFIQTSGGTASSDEIELHMAEKLLESAAQQQKNAFQFDTDTPKRGTVTLSSKLAPHQPNATSPCSSSSPPSSSSEDDKSDRITVSNSMLDSGIGLTEVQLRRRPKTNTSSTEEEEDEEEGDSSNSDENGGFITSPGADDKSSQQNQVKRATVVENPMFSSSPDSELINNPNESLGLDDLDMDYEQIMHYFDNLKESNA